MIIHQVPFPFVDPPLYEPLHSHPGCGGSRHHGGIFTRDIIQNNTGGIHLQGVYTNKPTRGKRTERDASNRALWEHNRKIILTSQSICGICGKPVDKSLKAPDPMSATVDHIIPISANGHPTDLDNLQLAHRYCNLMKSNKIGAEKKEKQTSNRLLPLTEDWKSF